MAALFGVLSSRHNFTHNLVSLLGYLEELLWLFVFLFRIYILHGRIVKSWDAHGHSEMASFRATWIAKQVLF